MKLERQFAGPHGACLRWIEAYRQSEKEMFGVFSFDSPRRYLEIRIESTQSSV